MIGTLMDMINNIIIGEVDANNMTRAIIGIFIIVGTMIYYKKNIDNTDDNGIEYNSNSTHVTTNNTETDNNDTNRVTQVINDMRYMPLTTHDVIDSSRIPSDNIHIPGTDTNTKIRVTKNVITMTRNDGQEVSIVGKDCIRIQNSSGTIVIAGQNVVINGDMKIIIANSILIKLKEMVPMSIRKSIKNKLMPYANDTVSKITLERLVEE